MVANHLGGFPKNKNPYILNALFEMTVLYIFLNRHSFSSEKGLLLQVHRPRMSIYTYQLNTDETQR